MKMTLRYRRGLTAAALACVFAGPARAQSCDCADLAERVRLLEGRIEMLEHRLHLEPVTIPPRQTDATPEFDAAVQMPNALEPGVQRLPTPIASSPTPVIQPQSLPTQVNPRAAPATVTPVPASAMTQARFYLFQDDGEMQPARDPDAAGLMPFEGKVSFRPSDYGFEAGGVFSAYDDPSLYPAVAVHLTGQLQIPQAGSYRLVVRPKPSREGGSAVRSTLSFSLLMDGREVIPETRTQAWRKVEQTVELSAGLHQVEIRGLAQSPGFGPSPTTSQLLIDIRGPRDAAPHPLMLSAP